MASSVSIAASPHRWKLTRGNQVTIPRPIVEQAKLKAGRDYLRAAYLKGVIVLTPIELKDRVAPKTYRRALARLVKLGGRRRS